MAWENANLIFPSGSTTLPDGNVISNAELAESEIKILTKTSDYWARQMLTKEETTMWGSEGEYAIGVTYDVMNCLPRPEAETPALSAYGMRMVRDFMILNDIDIN